MARLFRRDGANGRNAKVQRNDGAKGRFENEDLLKLNRGGFSTFAEDTGAQPSYLLPFGRARRELVSEMPVQRQPISYPEFQAPPELPPQEEIQPFDLGQQQEQQLSPAEEFLQLFEQAYYGVNPDQQGIASTVEGGTLLANGTIMYPDGSTRIGDPGAEPIASDQSGGVRYSDGSIRSFAGALDYSGQSPLMSGVSGGLEGLIQGIFGQNRVVTQAYGNYNPQIEPGSGYNLGTDIRTKDLEGLQRGYKLPIGAEVVEVLYDDGTRFGTQSGHQGYGNSVLLKLPTGEMLRFSHMDQMSDLQPGMRIQPGQVFGSPGQTGNTTGEHLDLEYYNHQGELTNPQQFSGFTDPSSLIQAQRPPEQSSQPQQQQQPQQQAQQPSQPLAMQALQRPIQTARESAQVVGEAVAPGSEKRQELGQGVEDVAKRTGIDTEFGVSESIAGKPTDPGQRSGAFQARVSKLAETPTSQSPYRQLLGNITERIGDTLGVPEGSLSETIAGGATKRTNQALASEIGEERPEEVPGIRQNLKDIGADLVGKAGAGIEALKGLFSRKESRPGLESPQERAVGDTSGGSEATSQGTPVSPLLDSAKAIQGKGTNDIRDPFFKTGQVDQFRNFLVPGAEQGQALTLDLFKPDFFKSKDTGFRDVFSPTSLGDKAESKYQDNRRQAAQELRSQLSSKYGDQKRYDPGEVSQLLSSIPDVLPEDFQYQEPTYRPPSLGEYLSQGKTAAQYYAETGQQNVADKLNSTIGLNYNTSSGSSAPVWASTPDQARRTGQAGFERPSSLKLESGRVVNAAPGKVFAVDSDNWPQQVDAPMSVPGTDAKYDPAIPVKSQSAKPQFSFTRKDDPGILNKFLGLFRR